MLYSIIISVLAIVGYFLKSKLLFLFCGIGNFVLLCSYFYFNIKNKDAREYALIRNTRDDCEKFIWQKKFVNRLSRLITYGLALFLIFWFFKLDGFAWIGVLFGIGYIPVAYKTLKTGKLE